MLCAIAVGKLSPSAHVLNKYLPRETRAEGGAVVFGKKMLDSSARKAAVGRAKLALICIASKGLSPEKVNQN